jgi:ubiquinone/menaquinone biosynthesis C-methylase UbiE
VKLEGAVSNLRRNGRVSGMKYNEIGRTYNTTRSPDERITERLISLLGQPFGSTILDIGAGTGNYSYELAKRGYNVIAIEPSEVMRGQGRRHERLQWKAGFAEELPIENNAVEGIICTLATHHFKDLAQSFREMSRVLKPTGKLVIFTADPRICMENCWISECFKEIVVQSCEAQPTTDDLKTLLEENTGRVADIVRFPLPYDLKDQFFFSGWRRPEAYLNEAFRSGISSLAQAPEDLLHRNLARLEEDLHSGRWHEKYGLLLNEAEFDCGYFFIVA